MMSDDEKRQVMARLSRVAGQVQGIQRMVDDDRYCVDVLLQFVAAQSALSRAGRIVLDSHIQTCFATAIASGDAGERDQKLSELLDVLDRYSHLKGP
jgi:CsoR family transcriptional regulator, copper-sensing transcriptional repressor